MERNVMNVIAATRRRAIGSRRRSLSRAVVRELRAVPDAMRWLLGLERR